MTNQFGVAVDARLIERSPAKGALRCRRAESGGGGRVGKRREGSEREKEKDEVVVCGGKHGTGSAAPKSLERGLHLPCESAGVPQRFTGRTF